MRLSIQVILTLALMLLLTSSVMAAPLVSIVFSANNCGNIAPCPVCGNKALGGLARRATAFDGIRKNQTADSRTVFIAGPYEFLDEDNSAAPADAAWPALSKAFNLLGYTSGCVSPAEAKEFADRGLSIPSNWKVLGKDVQSQVLETPNGKIGLVFFPVLNKHEATPSPETIDSIVKEAKRLKPTVKLLVGVSGWGVYNESVFLDSALPVLDVLLGGGEGAGFAAKPSTNSRTLWMHSYTKGKAVYALDILAWPTATGFTGEPGTQYASRAILLDMSYAQDPAMEGLFKDITPPQDNPK
jgi:hypothetical protein